MNGSFWWAWQEPGLHNASVLITIIIISLNIFDILFFKPFLIVTVIFDGIHSLFKMYSYTF